MVWSAGSVVVACGLSCSAAPGIFLDQGLNPCVSCTGRWSLYHWGSLCPCSLGPLRPVLAHILLSFSGTVPRSQLPGLLVFLLPHRNLFFLHCQSDTTDLSCSEALHGSLAPPGKLSLTPHPGIPGSSWMALIPLVALFLCGPAMQFPAWFPGHAPCSLHLGSPSALSTLPLLRVPESFWALTDWLEHHLSMEPSLTARSCPLSPSSPLFSTVFLRFWLHML